MVVWILVGQTNGDLKLNFHFTGYLNSEPFNEQTNPYDLNTKLVRYADPTVYKKGSNCEI